MFKSWSPRLSGTDFWKSLGNFWVSLTPRLPLMQAIRTGKKFQYHENICCGYSFEVPQGGSSIEYPQHMFFGEIRKILCGYPLLSVAMLLIVN